MTKIALDLDGVCVDFHHGFFRWIGKEPVYSDTYSCPVINEHWEEVKDSIPFWMSLKPLYIPQRVDYYITSRPIPSHISYAWLQNWGFPLAPVFTVNHPHEKLDVISALRDVDVFVDDRPGTVELMWEKEPYVATYLMDTWYNRHIKTEFRIKNLDELYKNIENDHRVWVQKRIW